MEFLTKKNKLRQDMCLGSCYPNGDDHAYEYDTLHRLHKHTTPKNEICTYTYDLRDRQILADWNTTTPDTARTYWANGLLKSVDNTISKSDYGYSVRNQLTSETQTLAGQAAKIVSHQYDPDGFRLQMNSPSGSPVDYEWTVKGQLHEISRDGPPPLATYGYDKAGRLDYISHENTITEDRQYDAASQLLANLHKKAGTTVSGHGYGLDDTGRRTDETFADGITPAREYTYDTADQIDTADYGNSQTDDYDFDPAGNRTTVTRGGGLQPPSQTYTANSANQYTSIGGAVTRLPQHDANGNLTNDGAGVTYIWDSGNRLLSVSDGTTVNAFTYDGMRRRVTKQTSVNGNVTAKTHFIYDGWNVVEEYSITNNQSTISRTLTWGTDLSGGLQGAGGVGGLLMVEEISGMTTTAHHFHYDGNGNVTEITDYMGNPTATYRYDAFGSTFVATGSYASQNKYRFSTKPLDDEIANAQLYYYLNRSYDPVTGRWPSRDPIKEDGGINLYCYIKNSPIQHVDILGLMSAEEEQQFRDQKEAEGMSKEEIDRLVEIINQIDQEIDNGEIEFPSEGEDESDEEDYDVDIPADPPEMFKDTCECWQSVNDHARQLSDNQCLKIPDATQRMACLRRVENDRIKNQIDCTNYHGGGAHWVEGGATSLEDARASWTDSPNLILQ